MGRGSPRLHKADGALPGRSGGSLGQGGGLRGQPRASVNHGHGSRHDVSRAARETRPIAIRPPVSGAFRSLQRLGRPQEQGQEGAQSAGAPRETGMATLWQAAGYGSLPGRRPWARVPIKGPGGKASTQLAEASSLTTYTLWVW